MISNDVIHVCLKLHFVTLCNNVVRSQVSRPSSSFPLRGVSRPTTASIDAEVEFDRGCFHSVMLLNLEVVVVVVVGRSNCGRSSK